jgi:hypothetical protein
VRGQGEGRRGPAQVRRVQSGVVLQQGARRAAHARARELLRGADSDLQLTGVRGSSVRACHVSAVQGGDVLQQGAQDGARDSARGSVRGAALVSVDMEGFKESVAGARWRRTAARCTGQRTCRRTKSVRGAARVSEKYRDPRRVWPVLGGEQRSAARSTGHVFGRRARAGVWSFAHFGSSIGA